MPDGLFPGAMLANSQVTLSATPSSGSTFSGWSGALRRDGVVSGHDERRHAGHGDLHRHRAADGRRADTRPHRCAVGRDRLRGRFPGLGQSGWPGHDRVFPVRPRPALQSARSLGPELHPPDTAADLSDPISRSTGSVRWRYPASSPTRSITYASSPPTARVQPSGRTSRSRPPRAVRPAPRRSARRSTSRRSQGGSLGLVNGHLVPLTQLQQIGPGTTIDTRHGTLELIIAGGGGGGAHDAAAKARRPRRTSSAAR